MNDMSRQAATEDDKHILTIEQVADRYEAAGHARTIRTLQRYCVSGHLDCLRAPTKLGDMYLVTPDSVGRHIAELNEISATTRAATDRGEPRSAATLDAPEQNGLPGPTITATNSDQPRFTATETPDISRYVVRLESENEFLRGQIGVKDIQIKDLTERARETNHLIAGLQRMLSPLLGGHEHRESPEPRMGDEIAPDVPQR